MPGGRTLRTVARVAAHLAPGLLVWAYILWSTTPSFPHGMYSGPVKFSLAGFAFLGGLAACWLPGPTPFRLLVILVSLVAAFVAFVRQASIV
jgi:hypothetical protein